jgi:enoyl-CoA hydratase/carnithine racemase
MPDAIRGGMTNEHIESTVLYEVKDKVAKITLNRPECLNAVTPPMTRLLLRRIGQAGDDEAVRVIVLTGAGRGFCSGGDHRHLAALAGSDHVESAEDPVVRDVALRVGKPIIAAINGPAAGFGLAIALWADVKFAARGVKLTTGFAKLGLAAGGAMPWLLPRLIGTGRALDLLYTARIFTSDEAYQFGLVQYLFDAEDLLEQAMNYALALAEMPSDALGVIRAQVYADASRTWAESFVVSHAQVESTLHNLTRPLLDHS